MWCLWNLGTLSESLYGRWTYAAVYLITGIAGGLASVGWNPGRSSVGASGAIFGLAGALAASFYLGEFSLPRVAIQGTLRSLVFFIGFNVLFGSMFPGIDNACHVGGLLSGVILGALIARVAPQHDAPLRRAGVLALVALIVVGAAFGVERWRGGPMRMARAFDGMSQNQPDRAIAQLQAILRQQPNFAQAHYALGQEFFRIGRYAQAETEFNRVLELQPQNVGAHFALGLVYLSEKRPEDAKNSFSEMLKQDADSADGHYGVGMALADEEKYQPAIDEFKTAIRLGPQSSGVYFELGRSYANLKMYDEAIAAYLQEKEKEGDDPEVETALGDAYEAKGMTQQAQEARNKAAQLKGGAGR
jgi:Flp pilus assembly protein TadD